MNKKVQKVVIILLIVGMLATLFLPIISSLV